MAVRPNRINIDLGPYKQRWLDYCRAHGVTPSGAFRQVVAKLTQARDSADTSIAVVDGNKLRKQITLSPSEAAYVAGAARREGKNGGQWIAALIRVQMEHQPQLNRSELELLAKSNLALLTIGRNLNQIARALNAGADANAAELITVLHALRTQITCHVDAVADLVASNLSRWRP